MNTTVVKQRGKTSAEAEADQDLHRLFLEKEEDDRCTQQTEADGEHAGDGARGEGEFERAFKALQRCRSGSDIALHRQPHADIARAI